jgi:Ran GTPase-activating protein (RanGAP) involved in mRNA processing and transport
MRALHTVSLRNNGIDDSFADELIFLITHTRIHKLDISHNDIGPKGITPFLTALKNHGRIKWIEYHNN